MCIYAISLVIFRFAFCAYSHNPSCSADPRDNLLVIFLIVESMLFGLFTLCMMADQSSVLSSNQTQIDKLKNQKHESKVDINEVLGTPSSIRFSLFWFLPIPTSLPDNVRDQVLGYRLCSTADCYRDEIVPLKSSVDERISGELSPVGITSEIALSDMSGVKTTETKENEECREEKDISQSLLETKLNGNTSTQSATMRKRAGPP